MEPTGSILIEPKCSKCGATAATIEICPPNVYPKEFAEFPTTAQEVYRKYRDLADAYMRYSGPGGSNGYVGDPLSAERVQQMMDAFTEPVASSKIRGLLFDDAGFCLECESFYCERCWAPSPSGYGHCPRGHGKSLDPFWNWSDD
jgi:hypothetical protein